MHTKNNCNNNLNETETTRILHEKLAEKSQKEDSGVEGGNQSKMAIISQENSKK